MSISPTIQLLLSGASVAAAFFAFVVSIYSARKSAAAKRQLRRIARKNLRVQKTLVKAYSDRYLDEREMRIILHALKKAVDEEELKMHRSANVAAGRFIRELHPQKSKKVIEDLAREASGYKVSI